MPLELHRNLAIDLLDRALDEMTSKNAYMLTASSDLRIARAVLHLAELQTSWRLTLEASPSGPELAQLNIHNHNLTMTLQEMLNPVKDELPELRLARAVRDLERLFWQFCSGLPQCRTPGCSAPVRKLRTGSRYCTDGHPELLDEQPGEAT